MHIIWQLLVGLIIGALAGLLLPGKEAAFAGLAWYWRWLAFALVGVLGSFLGTLVGRAIWKDQNYSAGWIMSILFAVILLVIVRYVF